MTFSFWTYNRYNIWLFKRVTPYFIFSDYYVEIESLKWAGEQSLLIKVEDCSTVTLGLERGFLFVAIIPSTLHTFSSLKQTKHLVITRLKTYFWFTGGNRLCFYFQFEFVLLTSEPNFFCSWLLSPKILETLFLL